MATVLTKLSPAPLRAVPDAPLATAEALALWRTASPLDLAALADRRRRDLWPVDVVTYAIDAAVTLTNICAGCDDCAEHCDPASRDGYILTPFEAAEGAALATEWGATRIRLTGASAAGMPLDAVCALISAVAAAAPNARITGLTPSWVIELATGAGVAIPVALDRLRRAGLQGLEGDDLCAVARGDVEIGWESWRRVMRAARRLGLATTAAIYARPGARPAELIAPLALLRDAEDLDLGSVECRALPGADGSRDGQSFMRLVALARLMLPGGTHVAVSYAGAGPTLAALALACGADDLVGTRAAGGDISPAHLVVRQHAAVADARRAITDLGYRAVARR